MGVDIPFLNTIFMVRPTSSECLYVQMVGRGSRIDWKDNSTPKDESGKFYFNLVEFTYNFSSYGESFYNGAHYFGKNIKQSSPKKEYSTVKYSEEKNYTHTPGGSLHSFSKADHFIPKEFVGLPYYSQQQFGLEIELAFKNTDEMDDEDFEDEFERCSYEILRELRKHLGFKNVATEAIRSDELDMKKDHSVWNVQWDGSCGLEVTTPKLTGIDGFKSLFIATQVIEKLISKLDLVINSTTGLHLSLGFKASPKELEALLQFYRYSENALASIVPPSRVYSFDRDMLEYDRLSINEYNVPLTLAFAKNTDFSGQSIKEIVKKASSQVDPTHVDDMKYLSLNISELTNQGGRIEIRSHAGTTSYKKMLLWTSIWMYILNRLPGAIDKVNSLEQPRKHMLRPEAQENCDLIAILEDVFSASKSDMPLIEQLHQRRFDLFQSWKNANFDHIEVHQIKNKWKSNFERIKNKKGAA